MKRVHASPARAACVCWAIASDTRIAYGSVLPTERKGSAARRRTSRGSRRGARAGSRAGRSPTYDRRPELEVIDALRRGVLDPANDLARAARRVPRGRARRLGLAVGRRSPAGRRGRSVRREARGLGDDLGARRGDRARPPGPARRRQHVPRSGADREARRPRSTTCRADASSSASVAAGSSPSTTRSGSTSGRASASGSTGSTSRSGSSGACSTGSGSTTTGGSTRCTTPCAPRGRSRNGCRSSSAAPGPTKTLRTTARHADLWNGFGAPERIAAGQRRPARAVRRDRPPVRRDRTDRHRPRRGPRHGTGRDRRLGRDRAPSRHRRPGGRRRHRARPHDRWLTDRRRALPRRLSRGRHRRGHRRLPGPVRRRDHRARRRAPRGRSPRSADRGSPVRCPC